MTYFGNIAGRRNMGVPFREQYLQQLTCQTLKANGIVDSFVCFCTFRKFFYHTLACLLNWVKGKCACGLKKYFSTVLSLTVLCYQMGRWRILMEACQHRTVCVCGGFNAYQG